MQSVFTGRYLPWRPCIETRWPVCACRPCRPNVVPPQASASGSPASEEQQWHPSGSDFPHWHNPHRSLRLRQTQAGIASGLRAGNC